MTPHIELGILAALAEGVLAREAADVARKHLAECRSCMAAYVDAVRYRAAWLAQPEAFEPDRELLATARAMGSPTAPFAAPARRRQSWPLAFAIGAILVVVSVPLAYRIFERSPSLEFRLTGAVLDATERSSARGLVLPGGELAADRKLPGLRSGQAISSPTLERELKSSIAAYESGPRTSEAGARVVAALLAAGEVDAASDYAHECLRVDPDHVPLLVFAADARYRLDDLSGAEQLLRRASVAAPRDPIVGLDLALVLRERGREAEARRLLDRVARTRVASLSARASRELGQKR